MAKRRTYPTRSLGFSMIEVLVTLVIVMLGLLGLLGVQVRSHQAEFESYQRSQALILVADMVDRINANRKAARCYEITTDINAGSPYVGTGYTATPACTAYGVTATQARAVADLTAWDGLLDGSAETSSGGANVGAMVGARGCISFNAGTNEFTVSVAWQGVTQLAAPPAALTCGKDLYGQETQRRVVSQVVRIADLR